MIKEDVLLVSIDFSRGEDVGVMVVGRKRPNGSVDIVNAFQGEEARELYEKLVTKKKLRIIEINPEFGELVKQNYGYCPCAVEKTPDTKCVCKAFRDQKEPGPCHCGRFKKIEA